MEKKLTYTGKTKDVYQLEDGNIMFIFKDDMTGTDGVFDPGANSVGLTVDGAGKAGLEMSVYYFNLIKDKNIPTHFISANGNQMTVKSMTPLGEGLEVICRYIATGSFIRRYGAYINEGEPLDSLIEMTLKNDECGDPLINEDSLTAISILKPGEYAQIRSLAQKISAIIKFDLAEKGMELCDIKLEFGKDKDGELMLIDEISGGNMRVKENNKIIPPLDLSRRITGK